MPLFWTILRRSTPRLANIRRPSGSSPNYEIFRLMSTATLQLWRLLNVIGSAQFAQRRISEAEKSLTESLKLWMRVPGGWPADAAAVENNLGCSISIPAITTARQVSFAPVLNISRTRPVPATGRSFALFQLGSLRVPSRALRGGGLCRGPRGRTRVRRTGPLPSRHYGRNATEGRRASGAASDTGSARNRRVCHRVSSAKCGGQVGWVRGRRAGVLQPAER